MAGCALRVAQACDVGIVVGGPTGALPKTGSIVPRCDDFTACLVLDVDFSGPTTPLDPLPVPLLPEQLVQLPALHTDDSAEQNARPKESSEHAEQLSGSPEHCPLELGIEGCVAASGSLTTKIFGFGNGIGRLRRGTGGL